MTGLETIINQIRLDAEEAARHELAQAKTDAEKTLAEAAALCEKDSVEIEKKGALKQADLLERAKSAALLDTRKKLLSTKQALIAATIEAAKEKLGNLSDTEYFVVLEKLLKKAATGQKGTLQLSGADLSRVPTAFVEALPKEVTLSKTPANLKNGFLLIYGGIDVNCSFDALFAAAGEELQDLVSDILFPASH